MYSCMQSQRPSRDQRAEYAMQCEDDHDRIYSCTLHLPRWNIKILLCMPWWLHRRPRTGGMGHGEQMRSGPWMAKFPTRKRPRAVHRVAPHEPPIGAAIRRYERHEEDRSYLPVGRVSMLGATSPASRSVSCPQELVWCSRSWRRSVAGTCPRNRCHQHGTYK